MNRANAEDGYVRVLHFLMDAIKQGTIQPGGRLPTERHLAMQFNIGRGIARRALAEMEVQRLIYRRVGQGTFAVPAPGERANPNHAIEVCSPAEYVEVRLRFEPQLAWMITANATPTDFKEIEEQLKLSEKATTMENFERHDAAFHRSLVRATHNSLAIEMYGLVDAVRCREHGMWTRIHAEKQTLQQRRLFIKEHREIFNALSGRDAATAAEVWRSHIRNTKRRIVDF